MMLSASSVLFYNFSWSVSNIPTPELQNKDKKSKFKLSEVSIKNLCNSLEKKVKDLSICSILLMSYTNHYSHTPSFCHHCKCKFTELRREKKMLPVVIIIIQRGKIVFLDQ